MSARHAGRETPRVCVWLRSSITDSNDEYYPVDTLLLISQRAPKSAEARAGYGRPLLKSNVAWLVEIYFSKGQCINTENRPIRPVQTHSKAYLP